MLSCNALVAVTLTLEVPFTAPDSSLKLRTDDPLPRALKLDRLDAAITPFRIPEAEKRLGIEPSYHLRQFHISLSALAEAHAPAIQ